ncbi:MAG TPA: MFS transporter, partial [Ktedonobacteraceae bacterium]|nr:MFS transporter [Ktedonobacteraceae bacterium]
MADTSPDAASDRMERASTRDAGEIAQSELPEALQAPTRRVGAGFQATYFLSNILLWMAKFPFTQIILPLQILALDSANKNWDLAAITAIGSTCGLISSVIGGALSDRTTSRFGRRRPFLVGGIIFSTALLFALAFAGSIATLLIEWALYQIAVNVVLAVLNAILPDQVPSRQRGLISAYTGMAIPLGLVLGSLIVTRVLHSQVPLTYFVIAIAFLIVILLLTVIVRDKQLPKELVKPFRMGAFLANLWVSPRAYPDFALAWITRFFLIMSSSVTTIYLLYFLQNALGYNAAAATSHVATFNSIYGGILIVAALASGYLSDRLQRRKIFVISAGLVVAVSMVMLAFAHSWGLVIGAAVLFGLGYGVYLGVDFALVADVLPSPETRGKDMGIFNIANTLPQV